MTIFACQSNKGKQAEEKSKLIANQIFQEELEVDLQEEMEFCEEQLKKSVVVNSDYTTHPRLIELGEQHWKMPKNDVLLWTVGFYPGILWQMYDVTKNDYWKEEALKRTLPLEPYKFNKEHHDVGFMMYCSYGQAYRLTGKKEYKEVLIESANSLITRYNPKVGTIKSWSNELHPQWKQHITIIDNMLNLELLFWASKETGDPKYKDIAVKHAETTMKHHFRDDFSTYHVVEYDENTGKVRNKNTSQGFADESVWARGQAWALYGYTMVYRETGDKKFLDFALKVSDRFIAGLPKDHIPYWDFDLTGKEGEPRDASAAAIAASGLVELSSLLKDAKLKKKYCAAADGILNSLASSAYSARGVNDAFLLHSTGAKPQGNEIDVALVYADYYYLEALRRRKAMERSM
ncbi:glucuronyl hydrolase [Marinifilum breve]|uniref:Glucuronyl hydrolase n=1 Tax=Marinifilum breve TaxID=2184082 RepID=A0A2V4A1G5_9BACT|nr:glycoside hydrolase family 88 protein [Marinifilum breve]PXY01697.1 glucuronyl hydrolase [Marinifilum breve]